MKKSGGHVYLTGQEMAEVDRAAIEDFGMDVLVLMENAGARVAELARRMLGGDVQGKSVVCLAGKGNNGGDGMVAARLLHGWGAEVSVVLGVDRGELRDVPRKQISMLEKSGVAPASLNPRGLDLVIDALLGYNSTGDPREQVAALIMQANDSGIPILAVDLPSGLDATSGVPGSPCIVASATVSFGFLKTGFLGPDSKKYVGELYLGDISLPRGLAGRCGMAPGVFREDSLVLVRAR